MQSKWAFIIISIVLILLALGGGYYLGKTYGILSDTTSLQSPMFSQQTGIIEGQVTKVEGNNLTIKSKNGFTQIFPTAPGIYINKISATNSVNAPQVQSSDNLSTIEIGKEATIYLTIEDGRYAINNVTYNMTATPVNATPATRSATPK